VKIARSLLEYLDRRLGRHAGNGPEYVFPCPACIDRMGSDSNKRKFAVNINSRRGQCFRCEYKFRDIEALFRYINAGRLTIEEKILLREDPPIVVGSIAATVRRILYKAGEQSKALRPSALPREYEPLTLANVDAPRLRRAHRYLRQRHVSLKVAQRFQVGFCATGKYAGYLIFPVVQGGGVVYWTSRYCGKHSIKSRNPDKREGYFSREHCLLNYDNVVGRRRVVLVEGPISATAPRHAIALMGRVMSPFQARLIEALVEHGLEELVIGLDPGTGRDRDAIRDTMSSIVPRVTDLCLTEGDPDDERDRIDELMAQRRVPSLSDRIRSRLTVA
jgi:hypothetical protein